MPTDLSPESLFRVREDTIEDTIGETVDMGVEAKANAGDEIEIKQIYFEGSRGTTGRRGLVLFSKDYSPARCSVLLRGLHSIEHGMLSNNRLTMNQATSLR